MRVQDNSGEGDFVIVHGRYSGALPTNWVVADILRIEDGVFLEHWDAIQGRSHRGEFKERAAHVTCARFTEGKAQNTTSHRTAIGNL
jgi:predicted SnoaL-like aldol condensation-catalyzing enzyme